MPNKFGNVNFNIFEKKIPCPTHIEGPEIIIESTQWVSNLECFPVS